MKTDEQIYKDWSGESHVTNSCHPVHDSAEAIDFARYYHREQQEKLRGEVIALLKAVLAQKPINHIRLPNQGDNSNLPCQDEN